MRDYRQQSRKEGWDTGADLRWRRDSRLLRFPPRSKFRSRHEERAHITKAQQQPGQTQATAITRLPYVSVSRQRAIGRLPHQTQNRLATARLLHPRMANAHCTRALHCMESSTFHKYSRLLSSAATRLSFAVCRLSTTATTSAAPRSQLAYGVYSSSYALRFLWSAICYERRSIAADTAVVLQQNYQPSKLQRSCAMSLLPAGVNSATSHPQYVRGISQRATMLQSIDDTCADSEVRWQALHDQHACMQCHSAGPSTSKTHFGTLAIAGPEPMTVRQPQP